MRITQILLSRQLGGAERHVAGLSNHLSRHHDVQVVLRRTPRRYAGLSHEGNIASLLDPRIATHEVGRLFRNRRIADLIRAFRPDIVHTHLGDAGKAVRAIRPEMPVIATLHGEYKDKCYRAHDRLICIAEWQRHTVPASFAGRIDVIPNFIADRAPPETSQIDTLRSRLGIARDAFVVGSVGRLSPEKGFDVVLRAFARAGLGNAVLVIVGDGDRRADLEALAPANVIFAGWQDDPWPFFHLFDVFVLGSFSESFGIAALEALRAGTPVISTRTEGPVAMLADGAGVLVDIGDDVAMAAAIAELARGAERRRDLSEKGRERAQDYRLDAVASRIEAVYRATLED